MASCSCVTSPSSLRTVLILVSPPQLRVQRDTHTHLTRQQEAFIFLGVKNAQVTMSLRLNTTSWNWSYGDSAAFCLLGFAFFTVLGRGVGWLKTKQDLCHKVSWKGPWYVFQIQGGFCAASGSLHDWHQTIVEVLLSFHIWRFNSPQHKNSLTAVLEIMYLFTTARQWARFCERPCILSLIFTIKRLCTVGPPEELHVSQPPGTGGESLIHF